MTEQSPYTPTAFIPTDEQVRVLLDWFATYDALVERGDVEAMADMALFPLTVTSNDAAGEAVAQQWDREAFVQAMAMPSGDDAPKLDNHREPTFLGPDLAVVVTNTTVTGPGAPTHMRYVDVMAKAAGAWRFTSMIQSGWGDMMRQHA